MTEIPKHLMARVAEARAKAERENAEEARFMAEGKNADDVIVATNPRDRIPAHLLQRSKAVANPQEPTQREQEFAADFMKGILHGIAMEDAAIKFEATGEMDLNVVIANKDRTIEASQKVIAGLRDALETMAKIHNAIHERDHRIIDGLLVAIRALDGREDNQPHPEPMAQPEPTVEAMWTPTPYANLEENYDNPYASRRAMFLIDLPGSYLDTHKRALIAIRDKVQETYGREFIMVPYLDPSLDDDTSWQFRDENRVTMGFEMVCTDEEAAEI
jgi:hypothetical protein